MSGEMSAFQQGAPEFYSGVARVGLSVKGVG